MSLTIKANTFATKRYLEVHSGGVIFCETSALGGRRTFTYQQIDCVLLSLLSLCRFRASFNCYMQSVAQRIAVSEIAGQIVFYVGLFFHIPYMRLRRQTAVCTVQ